MDSNYLNATTPRLTVLVTGATGLIGSAVADALVARGHRVLGLARSEEAAARLDARDISPVPGSLEEPEEVARHAETADAVVHAATTNDARNAALDAAVTRAILAALEGSSKPFVYTSGVWVLGDTGDALADETWPTRPLEVVAHRGPLEREVLDAAARGTRAIVLRPGIAYGRGAGIPAMIAAQARTDGVRVIGDGRQEWPVVHVEDLADLYVRALERAPAGSILHGVDAHASMRDIALAAGLGAGAPRPVRPWSLDEAARELGAFGAFFALHQRVSSARTRRELAWTPRSASLLDELARGSYAIRAPARGMEARA